MIKFQTSGPIWDPEDISHILNLAVDDTMVLKNNKKVSYYNVPASFDIETTSFTRSSRLDGSDEKVAIMYEWTFGINGHVIIGRTWEEFITLIDRVCADLDLDPESRRLIIYVHNLSYEFQFMRKRFQWHKIFSLSMREPVYAITEGGIEFRCSYLLSGYALAKLGDELQRYKVPKMVGDLDYSLHRHAKTPLTDKELKYCENDVRVVMAYIQECIENDGNILKIPLTKTGYVRKYCRDSCMYEGSHKHNTKKYQNYRKLMQSLTMTPDEYKQCKRAFQGGFTHASAMHSGGTLHQVSSIDFTSSYPYVMIAEKFPMSSSRLVKLENKEQFERYLQLYCCMFDVVFYDIEPLVLYENPISVSRCPIREECIINNGRVVKAKRIATTCTEQDFIVWRRFYKWDHMEIHNFRVYQKGYLPTDFVKSIVKLYKDKTELKGVVGKELEYLVSKGMVNACYGMTVTDICRDEISYTEEDEWEKEKPDIDDAIEKYNSGKRRFLFYPWGVWVTAYARRNLFSGITEFGLDYVYSDTDSIKAINYNNHLDYIRKYNEYVKKKLQAACTYHGIPFSDVEPETIKGEKKLLGVWDFEGTYDTFKTIGAKRYLNAKNGHVSLTVSGVNKFVALPYLLDKYGYSYTIEKDQLPTVTDGTDLTPLFDDFEDGLEVPASFSGKLTHTYIDDARYGVLVDYTGKGLHFEELSAVHLEPAPYKMSLSEDYIKYLLGVKQREK